MDKPEFVYVTYIRTSPEKVWDALVNPATTVKYWYHQNLSDWKPGSGWEHRSADEKTVRIVGKIAESVPPRRLVMTWARPEEAAKTEKHSRVTFDIEPVGEVVRLTVTHDRL